MLNTCTGINICFVLDSLFRNIFISLGMETSSYFSFFFFNDTATTEIYTLSLHDALPIFAVEVAHQLPEPHPARLRLGRGRSEEHTSELQSPDHLVCRLLLEKKKKTT